LSGRPSRHNLALVFALAIAVGCASPAGSGSPSATSPASTAPSNPASSRPPSASASAAPSASSSVAPSPSTSVAPSATASAAPSIAGASYDNPVYDHDFPDPAGILVGDTYYAYSTNAGSTNLPVIKSADLTKWDQVGDAMPALPSWAALGFGNTWAPGVIQIGDGFVMYFVDHDQASDRQCVGVATATKPEGSYHDDSDHAFICQVDLGGSIDPYPFKDADGKLYLLWKNDGNCCGKKVSIWIQALSDNGLKLQGKPTELISQDQAWEIPLIENPALVANGGKYYLFYSANLWNSRDYAVGYAVCDTITGPCVKPQNGPILKATDEARGPGGESVLTAEDGTLWMLYHAWQSSQIGYPQGKRSLRIDPLTFAADGTPQINGPTTDPQPLP